MALELYLAPDDQLPAEPVPARHLTSLELSEFTRLQDVWEEIAESLGCDISYFTDFLVPARLLPRLLEHADARAAAGRAASGRDLPTEQLAAALRRALDQGCGVCAFCD